MDKVYFREILFLLKVSRDLQTLLAAITHLVEGLSLETFFTLKVENIIIYNNNNNNNNNSDSNNNTNFKCNFILQWTLNFLQPNCLLIASCLETSVNAVKFMPPIITLTFLFSF
jgi:hypothetical protein